MKKVTALVLLVASLVSVRLLLQDSEIRAQEEPANVQPQANADLLARVALLEELVNFHSHERELRDIRSRLEAIEGSRQPHPSNAPAPPAIHPRLSQADEAGELKREVTRLTAKLATLERSVDPLKQDIAKLRLSMSRVESSVARIDLNR